MKKILLISVVFSLTVLYGCSNSDSKLDGGFSVATGENLQFIEDMEKTKYGFVDGLCNEKLIWNYYYFLNNGDRKKAYTLKETTQTYEEFLEANKDIQNTQILDDLRPLEDNVWEFDVLMTEKSGITGEYLVQKSISGCKIKNISFEEKQLNNYISVAELFSQQEIDKAFSEVSYNLEKGSNGYKLNFDLSTVDSGWVYGVDIMPCDYEEYMFGGVNEKTDKRYNIKDFEYPIATYDINWTEKNYCSEYKIFFYDVDGKVLSKKTMPIGRDFPEIFEEMQQQADGYRSSITSYENNYQICSIPDGFYDDEGNQIKFYYGDIQRESNVFVQNDSFYFIGRIPDRWADGTIGIHLYKYDCNTDKVSDLYDFGGNGYDIETIERGGNGKLYLYNYYGDSCDYDYGTNGSYDLNTNKLKKLDYKIFAGFQQKDGFQCTNRLEIHNGNLAYAYCYFDSEPGSCLDRNAENYKVTIDLENQKIIDNGW